MRSFPYSVLIAVLVAAPVFADSPPSFTVHPQSIVLHHSRQPQSVLILGTTPDGFTVDLRNDATITSANPQVARVDPHGWVEPVSPGETTLSISIAGQTQSIPVTVRRPLTDPPMSFRHEVMPVLTRAGCNMGACHGYSLGKNGFRLSLRGQDPEQDYVMIVREFAGRRVSLSEPSGSLLVAKARGDAPHEGGTRFARGSLSDRILMNWIAQGCPDDRKDTVHVVSVRTVPDQLVLKPSQGHQIQLIADYSDGTSRDVTRLGVFAVNNDQFASVSDEGLVRAGSVGETVIVGRFERVFAATVVTVLDPAIQFSPSVVPQDHLIDRHVGEKLNRIKVTPSPVCSDEEYLRRVYLDVIGLQPKPDEIRAFLADRDPKKRVTVLETLFLRPEYIDHWSLKWGDLLQNSRNVVSQPGVYQFRELIRSAIASNQPLDALTRQLLTSSGTSNDDPASVYFAISKDTNDTVERVTQVFCGIRMLCARCHPHPMENWTQGDYFGLASFFNQVSTRQDPRFPNVPNTRVITLNLNAGPATNPRTGRPQPPKFLGDSEPQLAAGIDRRVAYAEWLTSPKNPYFARSIVNRYWSYFFHRGIIDPVDDIRSTNPPINPGLLDALTADFVASGFDVRHLIRRIVTSQTYQRSSVPNASNRHDEQNFSHAIPRRIPAEALLDSLVQATGIPENIGGAPAGFRAAQLPDGNITSDFLRLFGKPQRMDACECERDNSSNMLQALHFINGKSILGRVQNPNARPAQFVRLKMTDEQLVTELYLWSLARHPSDKERQLAIAFIESYGMDRTAAAQDLMWALLNSRDFLLVH